jgi:hypothetical protein
MNKSRTNQVALKQQALQAIENAMSSQKKKNPRKRQPRKRPSGSKPQAKTTARMCAIEYLKVLEDPFSGSVSCVPTLQSQPSGKYSVFARGTATSSGTTGFGYIIASSSYGAVSNVGAVAYTTPLYGSDGSITPNGGGGLGVAQAYTNSQFVSQLSITQAQYRTVGFGLRVRNTTPVMFRGGTLWGLESPDHSDLFGGTITPNGTTQLTTTEYLPAESSEWSSVVWHPITNSDYGYSQVVQAISGSPTVGGNLAFFFLAPQISGSPASQSYEFEIFGSYEYVGSNVPFTSPSATDIVGLGDINSLTSNNVMRRPRQGERIPWLKKLAKTGQSILNVGMEVWQLAKPILLAL